MCTSAFLQTVDCAGYLLFPLPLVEEVTASKLTVALSRMTYKRTARTDGLHAELLKYGAEYLSPLTANIINTAVEIYRDASQVIGTLVPREKPGNPRSPVISLRAIGLLRTIRKAFSLCVLKRITSPVWTHLGPVQSGFPRGLSTTDVVLKQLCMVANALIHKWKYHNIIVLSINMIRAFDAIHRGLLLTVMGNIVGPDEIRMLQLLLPNTSLVVRGGRVISKPFRNDTGTPQGEGFSPVLFTFSLAAALRATKCRCAIVNLPSPCTRHSIPIHKKGAKTSPTNYLSPFPSLAKPQKYKKK